MTVRILCVYHPTKCVPGWVVETHFLMPSLAQSEDYSVKDTLLTLHAGQTRVCLEISLHDDDFLEYDETIEIELNSTSEDDSVVNVVGIQRTLLTVINNDSKYLAS